MLIKHTIHTHTYFRCYPVEFIQTLPHHYGFFTMEGTWIFSLLNVFLHVFSWKSGENSPCIVSFSAYCVVAMVIRLKKCHHKKYKCSSKKLCMFSQKAGAFPLICAAAKLCGRAKTIYKSGSIYSGSLSESTLWWCCISLNCSILRTLWLQLDCKMCWNFHMNVLVK